MTITRYAIRRISADGPSTTHELIDCGEEFELHVYDGDEGPVVTKRGELPVDTRTELLLDTGRPLFAFRLHQFLSKGDNLYVSMESEAERHVTSTTPSPTTPAWPTAKS